jgi:hypothetical protein
MQTDSTTPTWHEAVLAQIEKGNGVYALVDTLRIGVGIITDSAMKIWAVKSDTDEMGFYYVIDLSTGRRICNCDGFRYADHCKHTGRVPEK